MKVRLLPPALPALVLLACTALCPSSYAADKLEIIPTPQTIAELEQRALQAKPREQCFLYAELVHSATELAGKQLLAGETEQASISLKLVEHYARLIHIGLADDTKRLKNAELLMHHTTHKLSDYLRAASQEDHETLQATLKQLNQVQDELLTQVFRH